MTTSPTKALLSNLSGGLRLALLLPASATQFTLNQLQLVSMILLALLLDSSADWLDATAPREFNFYGISYLFSLYLVNIASLYFISLIYRQARHTVDLLIMFYASYPVLFVAGYLASRLLLTNDNLSLAISVIGLMFGWSLVILYRAIRLTFKARWPLTFASLLLYGLANLGAYLFMPQQPLWYGDLSLADNAHSKGINTEDTYYQQPALLHSALQDIAPGNPQTTEYYFVGFSADGRQDVFLKETYQASKVIDDLFQTANRSVLLTNHFTTYLEEPLASKHNLQTTLQHLDGKMNQDDILLLFLTAHGSKTYTLGVEFASMQLNDLSASELANMLKDTKIKWRVIIVSACYSGGFIDALANPHSLVITAAARDRQSSGCSDEYDASWFTDAYFNHALARTGSFITAYTLARDIVRQREQAEGVEFSDPQIFIGEDIRKRLGLDTGYNLSE